MRIERVRRLGRQPAVAAAARVVADQDVEVPQRGAGARDESGQLRPLDVQVGDRILFGKWSGTEIKLDGEDLLIMKESDVMGIIEAEAVVKKAA